MAKKSMRSEKTTKNSKRSKVTIKPVKTRKASTNPVPTAAVVRARVRRNHGRLPANGLIERAQRPAPLPRQNARPIKH